MSLSSLSSLKISLCLSLVFIIAAVFLFINQLYALEIIDLSLLSLTLLSALFYLSKVTKEINRALAVCRSLSMGDFSARITSIRDEGLIGSLMWSVNEMADHVDAFIREATACMEYVSHNQYFRTIKEEGMHGSVLYGSRIINQAMNNVREKMSSFGTIAGKVDTSLSEVLLQVGNTVTTLQNMTNVMENAVGDTRNEAKQAIHFSNETSQNVQIISAAAEEMSSAIAEISQQVSRTSQISQNAVDNTETSRKIMMDLEESSRRIGEIVTIIEEIAGQTNLLALNATIEAARAGEMGKGFAVVASEVKQLATQTAKATEEISLQIKSIQDSTEGAVKAFGNIGHIIQEIHESTSIVASAIEEQNAASREIASNAELASNGTVQVVQNITHVGGNIGQVENASQKVSDVTGELAYFSEKQVGILLADMKNFMDELKKIA